MDLQRLDSAIDAVHHRLATIPEQAALADLARRRAEVEGHASDLRIRVDDLGEELTRAERDVEQVRTRRSRDQQMIDGGAVTDPKALAGLVGEVASLDRRIGDLEDLQLDVMERLESAQHDLDAVLAEVATMEHQRTTLQGDRDDAAAGLTAERDRLRGERDDVAVEIPADLLALYDRLREKMGGVGAALLQRRECQGCRLTLNASEIARITGEPDDAVIRCDECQRILVRTAESGL